MPGFRADVLHTVLVALEGAAALFLGLTLSNLDPVGFWRFSCAGLIVFGAACGALDALHLSWFFLLVLVPVLAAAIKYLFSTPWLYAVIAGILSEVLFGMLRLFSLGGLPECTVLFGSLALCGLCWWIKAAILPATSAVPVINDKKQSRRFLLRFVLIALSFCEMLIWIFSMIQKAPEIRRNDWIYILAFTTAAFAMLLIFARWLAFSAMERIEALIDKQYQTELLNFMQIIRSQRHDFNFHLQAISGMVEGERYLECQDYIRQMTKNTSVMNDILPLHDPAVSAMLNAFREMALQKGIRLEVSIHNDLSRLPCTVYETNTIIGNLLQNAIDEVEKNQTDRWIRVLILKRGGDIIIKVSNPCSRAPEEFRDIFRPGYSTKQSHEGIGLTTVARLVGRYDGSVHPEFDHGTISFIVRIAAR